MPGNLPNAVVDRALTCNPVGQFADAVAAAGLGRPDIIANGQIQRFHVEGDTDCTLNGWYVLHLNGQPYGVFGSWKTGERHTWHPQSDIIDLRSDAERERDRRVNQARRQALEQANARAQGKAALRARARWNAAELATVHPYLYVKGIVPFGARLDDHDNLILPVFGPTGEIQSLQEIRPNGTKRFMSGGRMSGGWYEIQPGLQDATVAIVEGFATGASIAMAHPDWRVVMAFNAGNLTAVAMMVRTDNPEVPIILAGDDDHRTNRNPGQTKARAAARAVNGRAIFPPAGERGTDWNDYHAIHGLEALRGALDSGIANAPEEPALPDAPASNLPAALKKDIRTLADAADPVRVARSIAARHEWRVPVLLSAQKLADAIASGHPIIDRHRLYRFVCWLGEEARAKALALVSLEGVADLANARHRIIHDPAQALEEIRRTGGIHFLKSPHGSGKTESVLRPLAIGSTSAVAISNRISLVSDLATRLNLGHYQNIDPAWPAETLAICINSISNPRYETTLNTAGELVLVDEGARTARDCHDRKGTMGKNAPAIWYKLTQLIGEAQTAVIADADLSKRDVEIYLEALPRNTMVTVWEVRETPRNLNGIFTTDAATIAELDAALASGERCLACLDSARLVAELAEALRERHPTRRIMDVHAAAGTATIGRADVQALLADINGEVQRQQIDCLIVSPAIESGMSLTVAHFTRHFALYGGTVEPHAFNQAIRRDRTATTWTIGIQGAGCRDLPTDAAAILNDLETTARRTETLSDGRIIMMPATLFDQNVCHIEAEANRARKAYGQSLWYLLESRGWTCRKAGETTQDQRQTAREVRLTGTRIADEDLVVAILTAPDQPLEIVERLRKVHQPDPDTVAIIARADVRRDLNISGPLEPWHVALWQRGRLMGQLRLFKLLFGSLEAFERDRRAADAEVPLSLRRFEAATGSALPTLLRAAGIDPETGNGETNATSALHAFETLQNTSDATSLFVAGIAQFDRIPARPIAWLSRILGRLGLKLTPVRHVGAGGSGGRIYAIAQEVTVSATAERIRIPGWSVMMALASNNPVTVTMVSDFVTVTLGVEARLQAAQAWLDRAGETDKRIGREYLRRQLRIAMLNCPGFSGDSLV